MIIAHIWKGSLVQFSVGYGISVRKLDLISDFEVFCETMNPSKVQRSMLKMLEYLKITRLKHVLSSPPKILLKYINKGVVVLRELPPPKYDQRSNDKTREVKLLEEGGSLIHPLNSVLTLKVGGFVLLQRNHSHQNIKHHHRRR